MAYMFATLGNSITPYVSGEFEEDRQYINRLKQEGWRIHSFNTWHDCEKEHAKISSILRTQEKEENDEYDKSNDDFDHEWPDNTFGI